MTDALRSAEVSEAESFSRAAASYDSVAELQRAVGGELLQRLPPLLPTRWLDLGSGTGHFTRRLAERYPQAEGVALDLAEGMLRHARQQGGAGHFIAGDAERLPLPDGSLDLMFSSLAVQWCGDFAAVLAEAQAAGSPSVYWHTRHDNAAARQLYDRVARDTGFVVYRHTF